MKTDTKICTLKEMTNGWYATFSPGLPYDKRTKGRAHENAFIEIIQIQNNETTFAESYFAFYEAMFDKKEKYTNSYIHILYKCRTSRDKRELIKFIEKLGYKVVDKDKDLAILARAKLTNDEYKALRNSISRGNL